MTTLSTPVAARVPEPDDVQNAAVGSTRAFVSTVAIGMSNPDVADMIPVTIENEDGSTDSLFVLAHATMREDGAVGTTYAIAGLFFTNTGTSDAFKAWVDVAQPLVEAAIDNFAENGLEGEALPDPDEFARNMGIEPDGDA